MRPRSCERGRIPIASGHQARLSRRLVKDGGLRRTRTPSIAECSLPRSRAALSRGARGITRSPPPVSLLACSWLSPPRPGFRRRFTLCARTHPRVSQKARPMASRPGPSAARRLLQPTQPASTTAGPPEPRLWCNERSRRALARVARFTPRRCSRVAVGPGVQAWPKPCPSHHGPCTKHGWRRLAGPRQSLSTYREPRRTRPRPHPTARTITSRGFTGQEPADFRRWRLSSRPPLRAVARELYPNPIRSDTSRREIAASSAGELRRCPALIPLGGAPMTISPREPHPREG